MKIKISYLPDEAAQAAAACDAIKHAVPGAKVKAKPYTGTDEDFSRIYISWPQQNRPCMPHQAMIEYR